METFLSTLTAMHRSLSLLTMRCITALVPFSLNIGPVFINGFQPRMFCSMPPDTRMFCFYMKRNGNTVREYARKYSNL